MRRVIVLPVLCLGAVRVCQSRQYHLTFVMIRERTSSQRPLRRSPIDTPLNAFFVPVDRVGVRVATVSSFRAILCLEIQGLAEVAIDWCLPGRCGEHVCLPMVRVTSKDLYV